MNFSVHIFTDEHLVILAEQSSGETVAGLSSSPPRRDDVTPARCVAPLKFRSLLMWMNIGCGLKV